MQNSIEEIAAGVRGEQLVLSPANREEPRLEHPDEARGGEPRAGSRLRGARGIGVEAELVKVGGRVVCPRCAVADTAAGRLMGLLGRRSLPPGEGLLLRPASSVHTAFMRFPIDVVFLDRELEVIAARPGLRPWRIAARRGARAILELPAGECARRGISRGDRLALRPRS